MIRYENLLIAILLIFCLYASYTDLRRRKIPNLCSFGLIYSGLIFQILFVIQGKIAMFSMISILLGAIAISFLLYWFNIFAAGDSKLFLGASLALPPVLFQEITGRILFPPIVLAINTFAPYFLGMTIYLLVKSSTLQKKEALAAILDRKVLPILLVNYLGFFSLAVIVAAIWNKFQFFRLLYLNNFLRMAFILATFIALRKYTTKSKNGRLIFALFIPVAGILMFLSPPSLGNLFKSLLLYLVVYLLATPFLMNLVLPLFSKEIKISEIQEGVIPAETIVEIKETKSGEEKKNNLESKNSSNLAIIPSSNALPEVGSDEEFTSSHGQVEVDEDIRQVVIAKYYPDKLYDYLLCRADHLKGSWAECARKFKLDVGRINSIAKSNEGKKLFRDNIQRSQELKIHISPTMLVNGKIVDRKLFAKSVKGNCGL